MYLAIVKYCLWIQVLVPETQTGMEPEQAQATVAVAQPESEAIPETQSIEVTQTTSEMEVSREPPEFREEGAYVDSSAYLEATPSAAIVEESKPDDVVTQVVQPEKPVEPSGIEEEKGEEEEEVRERKGVDGMETVKHEAVKVLGRLHKKLQRWKVRWWMWRGVRRGVRRRDHRPWRN